jgi:adenylosuccinate synthase
VIRASDLTKSDLRETLAAIREQVQIDLQPILQDEFLPEDRHSVQKEVALLYDEGFLSHCESRFRETAKRAKIVSPDFFEKEILSREGVAVVESSHGILTDHFHGFHPHTSAIRTLPGFTHDMLRNAGFDGQIVNIGVTRAYQIRHGAGPMPTADPTMAESLLPGSNKDENRYQGKVRVGALDFMLLRYAIEVCGGPTAFDGLAISWFDQIQANGIWNICKSYQDVDGRFLSPSGGIKVRQGTDSEQLIFQEALGEGLKSATPEITALELPSANREELFSYCADVINKSTGVPVRMVSFGPTETDKLCR